MTTITFNTQELVKELRDAGIPQTDAEAVVSAIAKAQAWLVTKSDLELALSTIKSDLAVLKESIGHVKWTLGFLFTGVLALVAGMISLIVKVYFP